MQIAQKGRSLSASEGMIESDTTVLFMQKYVGPKWPKLDCHWMSSVNLQHLFVQGCLEQQEDII